MAVIRGSSHAMLLGEKGRISFCSNKSKQPACQARLCPYVTSPLALAPREGAHRSVPLVLGAARAGAVGDGWSTWWTWRAERGGFRLGWQWARPFSPSCPAVRRGRPSPSCESSWRRLGSRGPRVCAPGGTRGRPAAPSPCGTEGPAVVADGLCRPGATFRWESPGGGGAGRSPSRPVRWSAPRPVLLPPIFHIYSKERQTFVIKALSTQNIVKVPSLSSFCDSALRLGDRRVPGESLLWGISWSVFSPACDTWWSESRGCRRRRRCGDVVSSPQPCRGRCLGLGWRCGVAVPVLRPGAGRAEGPLVCEV